MLSSCKGREINGERCCNHETQIQVQSPCRAQGQPLRSHHGAAPEHWHNFKHHTDHTAGQSRKYLVQPEGAIICENTASPGEGGGTSAAIFTLTSGRQLNPHHQKQILKFTVHAAIARAKTHAVIWRSMPFFELSNTEYSVLMRSWNTPWLRSAEVAGCSSNLFEPQTCKSKYSRQRQRSSVAGDGTKNTTSLLGCRTRTRGAASA